VRGRAAELVGQMSGGEALPARQLASTLQTSVMLAETALERLESEGVLSRFKPELHARTVRKRKGDGWQSETEGHSQEDESSEHSEHSSPVPSSHKRRKGGGTPRTAAALKQQPATPASAPAAPSAKGKAARGTTPTSAPTPRRKASRSAAVPSTPSQR
jgi:hypothetical protein